MRQLMLDLHALGHEIEILSSIGAYPDFDHGDAVRAGKMRFLNTHYGDLLESGVIQRVNLVDNGHMKSSYASKETVLIDDMIAITDCFVSSGGLAILYNSQEHERCVQEILLLVAEERK